MVSTTWEKIDILVWYIKKGGKAEGKNEEKTKCFMYKVFTFFEVRRKMKRRTESRKQKKDRYMTLETEHRKARFENVDWLQKKIGIGCDFSNNHNFFSLLSQNFKQFENKKKSLEQFSFPMFWNSKLSNHIKFKINTSYLCALLAGGKWLEAKKLFHFL